MSPVQALVAALTDVKVWIMAISLTGMVSDLFPPLSPLKISNTYNFIPGYCLKFQSVLSDASRPKDFEFGKRTAYLLPVSSSLTRSLGYSNTISLMLCAPPFAFATSKPLFGFKERLNS